MKPQKLHAYKAFSLIIALLVAALSITSVLAAPIDTPVPEVGVLPPEPPLAVSSDLEQTWSNQKSALTAEAFFLDHLQVTPSQFKSAFIAQAAGIPVTGQQGQQTQAVVPFNKMTDWEKIHIYLDKYKFAMRQAQTLIASHAGFNAQGQVIEEKLAAKTVDQLSMYINWMRGLQNKIIELGGQVQNTSVVTTTSAP